jgi:hypothetical protein
MHLCSFDAMKKEEDILLVTNQGIGLSLCIFFSFLVSNYNIHEGNGYCVSQLRIYVCACPAL